MLNGKLASIFLAGIHVATSSPQEVDAADGLHPVHDFIHQVCRSAFIPRANQFFQLLVRHRDAESAGEVVDFPSCVLLIDTLLFIAIFTNRAQYFNFPGKVV